MSQKKIKQTVGECPLCKNVSSLADSHIIPQGCYRRIAFGEKSLVNIVKDTAILSQRQLKTKLLCHACEDRFNKFGERYFLLHCLQPDGSFPAFTRASLGSHALKLIGGDSGYWKADDVAIDYRKIAYFAASLFWRTFVAKSKVDRSISLELDPSASEALRALLNRENDEIPGIMIKVDLIERIAGRSLDHRYCFGLPQEIPQHNFGPGLRFYTSEALGFAFTMTTTTDPELVSAMHTNCLIHNPDHPIFISQGMQQATFARQAAFVQKSTPTEHLRAYNETHGH